MRIIRVLAIFLAIIFLSSCSINDPKFVVSKWGWSTLEREIDQTYTTEYLVGYTVSVAESEDGEYEELFTLYKFDNKLLRIYFNGKSLFENETKKYPQIKCANYEGIYDFVAVFKEQAIVGVSYLNYGMTCLYSTNVGDFDKLFDFKLKYYEFDIFNNRDGYKLYMENKSETMPINPLKNIVLDYSDVTYNGEDFSIGHTDCGLDLISKIICDGKELIIKMEIAFYYKDESYSNIQEYLDTKDSFQSFTEWPDNYLQILNDKLRNQLIPVPDGISMYNDMIGLFGEKCELKVFLSNDEFIDNYATKLESNGFYLSPYAKGNYFKKVTTGNQDYYIHIYLQKRSECDYIRFGIEKNDSTLYDLK